jgi:hypothetical protein
MSTQNNKISKALIIVNNIPPYSHEIVNIQALPPGFVVRFRYQKKYVPTLWGNTNALKNKQGCIVVRNRSNTDLIPIRSIIIKDVRVYGDVVYVSVVLKDISPVPNDDVKAYEFKNKFDTLIKEAIKPYKDAPDYDLENLVLLENGNIFNQFCLDRESSGLNEMEYWANAVKLLSDKFGLKDIDFYRVTRLTRGHSEDQLTLNQKKNNYSYSIERGKSYYLELMQRTYIDKKGDSSLSENKYISLVSSSDDVVIYNDKIKLLGKYDIFGFDFFIKGDIMKKEIELFLEITNNDSGFVTPYVIIPLSIRASGFNWLCFMIFLILIITFIFLSSTYTFINKYYSCYISESDISKGLIVLLILIGNMTFPSIKEVISKFKIS